jgi:hypothetical protein
VCGGVEGVMRRESVECSGAWVPVMARLAGINSKVLGLCRVGCDCGQSFGRVRFYKRQ